VVVADDSYLVREGIVRILAVDWIELVGAAADLDETLMLVDRERPDVVVTDIRMPPTMTDEGIRLAVELASSHPDVGVVVLSQHARGTYATHLFEARNARRGYLVKERLAEPRALLDAIRSVSDGRPYLDPEIVDLIIGGGREETGLENLTERELTVLSLIADGRSNPAIAEELVLTTRAVERHVNAIFAKLDLHDAQTYNRRVLAALLYARGRSS
jgi:DNA-binding NarL/FixJ family response regulator